MTNLGDCALYAGEGEMTVRLPRIHTSRIISYANGIIVYNLSFHFHKITNYRVQFN